MGQPQICYLDNVTFSYQNISGTKVLMDVVVFLQVCHATSYLCSYVYQLGQFQVLVSS